MKSDAKIFLVICFGISSFVGQETFIYRDNEDHPDSFLSTVELIEKYKYPVEIHDVTTEDGYILTIFRIPHGRMKKSIRANKKPILLMHGMFGQAENFIVNGMNNGSLAYFLADNGYDVWLGNTRGTKHGKKHEILKSTEKEFWNFSFHEIAIYDLPSTIDYILKKTYSSKLSYVGHSQGGTTFYIMCSMRPEYQEKITTASLMAPGGFENHFENAFLRFLSVRHVPLTKLAEITNLYEMPPSKLPVQDWIWVLCKKSTFRKICLKVYSMMSGIDSGEVSEDLFPLLTRFVPSVSTKQLLHFGQVIASGHFRPWDYGEAKNLEIYGKKVPDDYPVENITVPTAMYYSVGDNLSFAKDVEEICDIIQNCFVKFQMPNEKWAHFDFLASKNALEDLYKPMLEITQIYEAHQSEYNF